MRKIIIIGAGSHTRVRLDVINYENFYLFSSFVDLKPSKKNIL